MFDVLLGRHYCIDHRTDERPADRPVGDDRADEVIIDDGRIAPQVRRLLPDGVDAALELVGAPTLRDTLGCVRERGICCFTGMLSDEWIVKDFYPIGFLPRGVRLSAYAGEASDLPAGVLQDYLDDVAQGRAALPLWRTFPLEQAARAHALMESGEALGKMVLLP